MGHLRIDVESFNSLHSYVQRPQIPAPRQGLMTPASGLSNLLSLDLRCASSGSAGDLELAQLDVLKHHPKFDDLASGVWNFRGVDFRRASFHLHETESHLLAQLDTAGHLPA